MNSLFFRNSTALLVVLIFLALHQSAYAQGVGSASKLKVTSKLSVDKVTPGSTFKVAVVVTIAEGWHVNSNTPASDYLIGTALEVSPQEDFLFNHLTYPKGKNIKFVFSEDPLNVYEKEIKIFFTVTTPSRAKPGKQALHATLTAQACNDQICLAPSEIEVKIPITVVGSKEKSRTINDDVFSSFTATDSK